VYGIVKTGKRDDFLGVSSRFLDRWISVGEQNRFGSSIPGLDKVVPGEKTFWYGISFGAEGGASGPGGITSRNPFVCNFYVSIEPMPDDGVDRTGLGAWRGFDLTEPLAGVPAELTGKQY
jgi:hypothetical protein